MLSLSVRSQYALAAVFELARHVQKGPIRICAIAQAQNIPQNYLEQLLIELKKGGVVRSFRGSQGGYVLAKSEHDITVYEVLVCLEGEVELAGKTATMLESFWTHIEAEIRSMFTLSIGQLLADKQKEDKTLTYAI